MDDSITLTDDQQIGFESYVSFIIDPEQSVFILGGFAGTGKTTLVEHMVRNTPGAIKTARLLNPNAKKHWHVDLTATTNKAADAVNSTVIFTPAELNVIIITIK